MLWTYSLYTISKRTPYRNVFPTIYSKSGTVSLWLHNIHDYTISMAPISMCTHSLWLHNIYSYTRAFHFKPTLSGQRLCSKGPTVSIHFFILRTFCCVQSIKHNLEASRFCSLTMLNVATIMMITLHPNHVH